ncbi:2-oxo-4-hydroxy-4-carboxy-5-ureidoimidazoline decarboxylase [Pseudovibrio sp. Tun.PSC04-5.I4]|uniref:2-oxo-4-hydroxy-4-carboxy-5-ureidoimidazoline decarboxylase n=1 Tax=Pseudovibrio sp. Tun.PSC04-5.I4 TaxID=1798213 RepID=UPI0008840338|nr:2-oxo-4-hydroxy-4-carboxy-5-ureidoimidazoline decarboxylase [Pseudovibrio sp. Tun.PSC04-5.I4]SDR03310.1 2-oxo-4-hydroxy-4-carboxy-5-ureidoimidazoline decarboxylase [Pseudovibrio sp. Tun.PSC04-5.I4]
MNSYRLEEINQFSLDTFTEVFGGVAEHSPWVCVVAYREAPFASRDGLIQSFADVLLAAGSDAQLALIRAHPDLAGKAARAGQMEASSVNEQAGVGLDQLTDVEYAQFTEFNNAYKSFYGFPFIFAVKGATKHQILEAFQIRLKNSADEEFAEALRQICRIFRFRLEDLVVEEIAAFEP